MRAISIVRGDDCTIAFEVTEAYDADGNPLQALAGLQVRFTARLHPDAPEIIFEKSTAAGTIMINGMSVNVRLAAGDTATLAGGTVLFADLQLEDSSNRVVTMLVDGHPTVRLVILPDVTH